jgi:hypothetical protein
MLSHKALLWNAAALDRPVDCNAPQKGIT